MQAFGARKEKEVAAVASRVLQRFNDWIAQMRGVITLNRLAA
jgi:uncharacterized protein YjiS (DUF1127 family)